MSDRNSVAGDREEIVNEHLMLFTEKHAGFFGQVHGGYLSGVLARDLSSSAQVRLRRPLATGSEVTLVPTDDGAAMEHDGVVIAEGASHELSLETPPPIDFSRAERASHAYPGFGRHLFPGCFCCGPAREEGDGLRVFPGPLGERNLAAAAWVPHHAFADAEGVVRPEILWAALDCPALWSLIFHAPADSDAHVVTGTIAMHIAAPVRAGERHVILAWPMGADRRKVVAGAALYKDDGTLLAAARQLCIVVDKGVPLGSQYW